MRKGCFEAGSGWAAGGRPTRTRLPIEWFEPRPVRDVKVIMSEMIKINN